MYGNDDTRQMTLQLRQAVSVLSRIAIASSVDQLSVLSNSVRVGDATVLLLTR